MVITMVKSQLRGKINPYEETSLNFRVWVTDADIYIMNNAAYLTIMEMGRLDLMIRTGFMKHARKNGWYVPLASISVQFRRSVKRFQKLQLKTQIIYWDEKWVYLKHRIVRNGKLISVALAKGTVKKGRDRIPFETILHGLKWERPPRERPKMIDEFDRGETLLLKKP